MSFGRLLLVSGALVSTFGMAGMWQYARSLVDVFRTLSWQTGEPPLPDVQAALTRLTLSAMLFAVGLLLIQRGLTAQHRAGAPSLGAKLLVALAGVGLVGAGKLFFWGMWSMHSSFTVIAGSVAAPKASEVELAVGQAAAPLSWGLGLATVTLLPLLVLGLGAPWREIDHTRRAATGRAAVLIVMLVAIVATSFALVLACRAGLAAISLLRETSITPKPSDLAQELMSVLRYGLLGGVGLAVMGTLQLLSVFTFPRAKAENARA
jgi:hypothetical protein